jgi:hypothetical protein
MPWKFLGEGEYNKTYHDPEQGLVLKIQKLAPDNDLTNQFDDPIRSVRLFELITGLPAKVVVDPKYGRGWTYHYIKGDQAPDADISKELIAIYSRSQRIIVDAPAKGNFLKTSDGKVFCVDIGLALQMKRGERVDIGTNRARANSQVSLNAWELQGRDILRKWNRDYRIKYPITVNTMKALLFIATYYPNIINVNFLNDNPDYINRLASGSCSPDEIPKMIALDTLKNEIINTLNAYILSRGSIIEGGRFRPSMHTQFFYSSSVTDTKVRETVLLIQELKTANSPEDIALKISRALKNQSLLRATFSSGLATALGRCKHIIELHESIPPEKSISILSKPH